MTMKQFIEMYRPEIDKAIMRQINYVPRQASCNCPKSGTDHYHDDARRPSNEDRRMFVINCEPLYLLARRHGVRV